MSRRRAVNTGHKIPDFVKDLKPSQVISVDELNPVEIYNSGHDGYSPTLYTLGLFHEDNILAYSHPESHTVHFYDYKKNEIVHEFLTKEHQDNVRSIEKLDDETIATQCYGGVLVIWDWYTSEVVHKFDHLYKRSKVIQKVGPGMILLSIEENQYVFHICEYRTGKLISKVSEETIHVYWSFLLPTGNEIITYGNRTMQRWSYNSDDHSMKCLSTLRTTYPNYMGKYMSIKGEHCVGMAMDEIGAIHIYNIRTLEFMYQVNTLVPEAIYEHYRGVRTFSVLEDGMICVGTDDKTIKFFRRDEEDNEFYCMRCIETKTSEFLYSTEVTTDFELTIVGCSKSRLWLTDSPFLPFRWDRDTIGKARSDRRDRTNFLLSESDSNEEESVVTELERIVPSENTVKIVNTNLEIPRHLLSLSTLFDEFCDLKEYRLDLDHDEYSVDQEIVLRMLYGDDDDVWKEIPFEQYLHYFCFFKSFGMIEHSYTICRSLYDRLEFKEEEEIDELYLLLSRSFRNMEKIEESSLYEENEIKETRILRKKRSNEYLSPFTQQVINILRRKVKRAPVGNFQIDWYKKIDGLNVRDITKFPMFRTNENITSKSVIYRMTFQDCLAFNLKNLYNRRSNNNQNNEKKRRRNNDNQTDEDDDDDKPPILDLFLSNLTIRVKNEKFGVHRDVMINESNFFCQMERFKGQESEEMNSQSRSVGLEYLEVTDAENLIYYLYHRELRDGLGLPVFLRLLVHAEKYCEYGLIQYLKNRIQKMFRMKMNEMSSSLGTTTEERDDEEEEEEDKELKIFRLLKKMKKKKGKEEGMEISLKKKQVILAVKEMEDELRKYLKDYPEESREEIMDSFHLFFDRILQKQKNKNIIPQDDDDDNDDDL